jgi:hypothetical protein
VWLLDILKSPPFWWGIALSAVIFLMFHFFLRRRRFYVSSVTLALPFGLGNISYQASDENRILAWRLYVHLKTRKAALPLDNDNDVIVEVYDSLYELFQITRDLLCSVPIRNLQGEQTLADLILRVQNDGLRPHLTKWQAPFRRWWTNAIELPENHARSPQEIQRQFPAYDELVNDLQRMNTEVAKFAEELLRIVRPPRRFSFRRLFNIVRYRRTAPEAPSPSSVEAVHAAPDLAPPTTTL